MGKRMNRIFQSLWLAILVALASLEAIALVRKRPNDTLSEYTRYKTTAPVMKAALGGLLGWLMYHWLYTDNGSYLGVLDGVTAGVGVLVGLLAHWTRKRRENGR